MPTRDGKPALSPCRYTPWSVTSPKTIYREAKMPEPKRARKINGHLKSKLESDPFLLASTLSRAAFDTTGRSQELAQSAGVAMSSIYDMMEAQAQGPLRGIRYSSIDQMLPLINHC